MKTLKLLIKRVSLIKSMILCASILSNKSLKARNENAMAQEQWCSTCNIKPKTKHTIKTVTMDKYDYLLH